MLKNLGEQLFALQEWKNLITIVVTHWDRENSIENRLEYETTKKKILNIYNDIPNSFIFIGKDSNPKYVCQAFYQCLCICQPIQLNVSDLSFQYRFDIYENMDKQIRECNESFKSISDNINNAIISYNQDEKDEFLHACIVKISQIAEQMIDEFSIKNCQKMVEIDSYVHYLQLKATFMPIIQKIRMIASDRMSYNLLDKRDPRNMYKACPHCNLIWVKVQGCDGQTSCGNRLDSDAIFDRRPSENYSTTKFIFSWQNKIFKWVKQSIEINSKFQIQKLQTSTSKGVGCGKLFIWNQQPSIDKKILDEFKDAGLTDYFANYQEGKAKALKICMKNKRKK